MIKGSVRETDSWFCRLPNWWLDGQGRHSRRWYLNQAGRVRRGYWGGNEVGNRLAGCGARKQNDSGTRPRCRVRVEASGTSKQDPRVTRNVAHKDPESWM